MTAAFVEAQVTQRPDPVEAAQMDLEQDLAEPRAGAGPAVQHQRAQRRSVFTPFSIQAGIEHGDPSEPGILPTFGLSIPLPLLD